MTLELAHTHYAVTRRPEAVTAGGRPIRVVLADAPPAVGLSVRTLIDDQPDMRVVADARTVEEALGYLEDGDDVAVVDYRPAGGRDGLWVIRRLKRLPIPPRVLVCSTCADPGLAVAARIAGADGLVAKDAIREKLSAAIRLLAAGGQHLAAVPAALADALRSRVLPEDQAIYEMLLAGVPSKVIVRHLPLSRDDVEDRRGRILCALTGSTGDWRP